MQVRHLKNNLKTTYFYHKDGEHKTNSYIFVDALDFNLLNSCINLMHINFFK